MQAETPFTPESYRKEDINETNKDLAYIGPWGEKLTGEYIASLSVGNKEALLQWLFNKYRASGFPYPSFSNEELKKEFEALKRVSVSEIVNEEGEIKNSNSKGTKIVKHFCGKHFYSSKGNQKSFSCLDVFLDDDKLKKVIRNRTGWEYYKSIENGIEIHHPYVFPMSDSMLIQGMRSSGLAYSVSQFKPCVARYVYSRFARQRVFDYSAGWGARCLGALSLGLEYYAVDPLTADSVNSMIQFFGGVGKVLKQPSEEEIDVPKCDFVFSSPPYFDLEIYSKDSTQSTSRFSNYEDWLENYWKASVLNCLKVLESDGKFGLTIVDMVAGKPIAQDMVAVCESCGLSLIEKLPWKTSKSHLSGKSKTRVLAKNTEAVYIFERTDVVKQDPLFESVFGEL